MTILETEEIKIKLKKAHKNHFKISIIFTKNNSTIHNILERSEIRELIEKLDNSI